MLEFAFAAMNVEKRIRKIIAIRVKVEKRGALVFLYGYEMER